MKKGWLVFLVLLAAAALTLSGILLGKLSREEKIFQEQAALNGIVYDEAFLEEAAKLPGIQSVKPVVSLPVQLKVGEYSVETELLGVELTDLHYQAEKASDTALGRTPALLIGKEALFGLVDANGHAISEKRLGQLLEEYHGERGDEFPEGKGKLCPDEGRLIKRPWPESREAQIRPQWWPSRQRSGAYRRRSSFQ